MRRFLDAHETPKVGLWGCLLTCPMRVSSWASYVLRVGCIAHDVMRGVIVCPHLLVENFLCFSGKALDLRTTYSSSSTEWMALQVYYPFPASRRYNVPGGLRSCGYYSSSVQVSLPFVCPCVCVTLSLTILPEIINKC